MYWIALAIGTHIPNLRLGPGRFVSPDQALHIIAYIVFPILIMGARIVPGVAATHSLQRTNVLAGAAIAFAWGLITELTQELFVPGRSATFKDVWSNSIGVSIALAIAFLISHQLGRPRRNPVPNSSAM
jgi:VanZ family protein